MSYFHLTRTLNINLYQFLYSTWATLPIMVNPLNKVPISVWWGGAVEGWWETRCLEGRWETGCLVVWLGGRVAKNMKLRIAHK